MQSRSSTRKIDVINQAPITAVVFTFGGMRDYDWVYTHHNFAELIRRTRPFDRLFFEYIRGEQPVTLFFDIDCPRVAPSAENILDELDSRVMSAFLNPRSRSRIVLSSHKADKLSYHVLYRIKNNEGHPIYFQNVEMVAAFYDMLSLSDFKYETKSIIDRVVYRRRGGLFRTYLSNKDRSEVRPVVRSSQSDSFNFEETFVTFCPEIENATYFRPQHIYERPARIILSDNNHRQLVAPVTTPISSIGSARAHQTNDPMAVRADYLHEDNQRQFVKDILTQFVRSRRWDNIETHVYLYVGGTALRLEFLANRCLIARRQHSSNNQYVEFTMWGARYKCHNQGCANTRNTPNVKFRELPTDVKNIIRDAFVTSDAYQSATSHQELSSVTPSTHHTMSNTDEANPFDGGSVTPNTQPNNGVTALHLTGSSRRRRTVVLPESELSPDSMMEAASQYIRSTTDPDAIAPVYSPRRRRYSMPVTEACAIQLPHPAEHSLSQMGYTIDSPVGRLVVDTTTNPVPTQIVNFFNMNITTIVNNYNDDEPQGKEVSIESSLFDETKTSLWNNALNKLTEMGLAELFMHCTSSVGFDDKGACYVCIDGLWQEDIEHRRAIKQLVDLIRSDAMLIITAGSEDEEMFDSLKKRISRIQRIIETHNSARNTLRNCASCYAKTSLESCLDGALHLVPFTNGVWDLDTGVFRRLSPDDYVMTTVGYAYDESATSTELDAFICSTLPDEEKRKYFLKRCSDCLDTRISNDTFIFLTGSGANGKSAFLTLMGETFGQLGTTMRPRVFTGREADPSAAQPDIAKLEGKRFASLVEEDSGSATFNIGLFKRLTGGDKVSTRQLRKRERDIYMRTKFFYACNHMPEFPSSEQALWRRIRVVEFDQTFSETDQPGVHIADKKLVYKIMSDVTWRQSFMKILILYTRIDIQEPTCVQISTTRYRQASDDFAIWLDGRITEDHISILTAADVVKAYNGPDTSLKGYQWRPYNVAIQQHLDTQFGGGTRKFEHNVHKVGRKSVRGWKGFRLDLNNDNDNRIN